MEPFKFQPSEYNMLARLQQAITLSVLAAASGWLLAWWAESAPLAMAGFVAIALGYTLPLGLGFVALRTINKVDAAGAATWGQTLRAWWQECTVLPKVFFWRQPFRSKAIADYLPRNGRRGVVFVHGFVCNRGIWTPWLALLRARGRAFVAVNLEPVFVSIDEYVATLEAAVRRVEEATGMPPVLVCHSMGGLAARAWLRHYGAAARVKRVVSIGTPHHGTWLGHFSHTANGIQMRLGSQWLQQLQQDEAGQGYDSFTCWYSNCDNIVFPASTATLASADNQFVPATAHVSLAFHPAVMAATLALICDEN